MQVVTYTGFTVLTLVAKHGHYETQSLITQLQLFRNEVAAYGVYTALSRYPAGLDQRARSLGLPDAPLRCVNTDKLVKRNMAEIRFIKNV